MCLDRIPPLAVGDRAPPTTCERAGPTANAETARDRLSLWRSGGDRSRYFKVSRETVAALRAHLSKCPDRSPAPTTTALAFIPDADLRASIRLDISSANSDLADGRWKGSTVLAGPAVEALLLWGLQRHEQQNAGAKLQAIAALRAGNNPALMRDPDANIEKWDLHEYTEVAAQLGIIKADTAAQVRLARTVRNLIHPGRAQRLGQKADRFTALSALAAVEGIA